jgi:hypothetical protein
MNHHPRACLRFVGALAVAAMVLAPMALFAQTAPTGSGSRPEQWIHIRVDNKESKGEVVRVNLPVAMAEKILPAVRKNNLHDGKVHIDSAHLEDVDVRSIIDAVRSSKDGEFVTVQSNENDVRVAKSGGYLYIHVREKSATRKLAENGSAARESKVEVKVPIKVVDALFSAGKDELDVLAALRVLASTGDTELVTVKNAENNVRIWIDSKNVAD